MRWARVAGTATPNLRPRLRDQHGDEYRIVQNNAFDRPTQTCIGVSIHRHEIWLNCEPVERDFKILTGFFEPRYFAALSGGGKAIMPGMAGQRTVLGDRDAEMIANLNAIRV